MNRFILLCVSVVVSRSPALARGEAEDTLASLVVQGHAGRSPARKKKKVVGSGVVVLLRSLGVERGRRIDSLH